LQFFIYLYKIKIHKEIIMLINKKQRGVTLLETILVLALIAIMIIGGLNLYKNAKNASDANRAVQQIVSIDTGIKNMFNNGNYGGLWPPNTTGEMLIKFGVVPSDMISSSGTEIVNMFSSSVNPISWPGNSESYMFNYGGIPNSAICTQILTKGLGGLKILASMDQGNNPLIQTPLSISDATRACTGFMSGGKILIQVYSNSYNL
jgi:prepilin-type N-terminal cleavage/methylation domain-containing protein